jgi:3-oxoacyl-(acyl-carrier-protein) synthase
MRRVVITGVGVLSSAGIGKETFWENSLTGRSFVTSYKDFAEFQLRSRIKGSIGNFNCHDFCIDEEEKERMGRPTQLAVAGTCEALKDSKIDLHQEDLQRIGVCIGNAIADTPCSERQFLDIRESTLGNKNDGRDLDNVLDRHLYFKSMFSCISTEISAKFGFKGNTFSMVTGCTSGIDAAGYAFEAIREGDVDIMVSGATEAPLTLMTFTSFDVVGATSKKSATPEKASSPFDATRDGFVLAEGCGILIFEELEHALHRGAPIYGEVAGFATNNNGMHMTDLHENGEALSQTIDMALNEAGIGPGDIQYINAHGSSTQQNDLFETNAYKKSFGHHIYEIPISSTKSIVGHPLGAASAIELVHCCLVLQRNKVPPTVNLDSPDPRCDLDYIPHLSREHDVDAVLTNANGFSGIHSAMILRRFDEQRGA